MAIIGTLPNSIQNGQTVDANPVMADFNFIVNQVNANGTPLGTLTAPAGTAMPFQQAAAPLGWTAQSGAAFSDAFLRVVTPGNFTGTGGVNAASGFIIAQYSVDGHSLTVGELASHSHTDTGHVHGVVDGGHIHSAASTGTNFLAAGGGNVVNFGGASLALQQAAATAAALTGISIATGSASIANTGSGTAHAHTHTANCKFVDHIVAVKA